MGCTLWTQHIGPFAPDVAAWQEKKSQKVRKKNKKHLYILHIEKNTIRNE